MEQESVHHLFQFFEIAKAVWFGSRCIIRIQFLRANNHFFEIAKAVWFGSRCIIRIQLANNAEQLMKFIINPPSNFLFDQEDRKSFILSIQHFNHGVYLEMEKP